MVHAKKQLPPAPSSTQKVAVLLPGMGAVATTFIAGVGRIRQGGVRACGEPGADRHDARERQQGCPAHPPGRGPGWARPAGFWRLGHLRRHGPTRRQSAPACSTTRTCWRQNPCFRASARCLRCLTRNYVKNLQGPHVKQGESKWHFGPAACPGHPRLHGRPWVCTSSGGVVRLDRALDAAGPGAPEHRGV